MDNESPTNAEQIQDFLQAVQDANYTAAENQFNALIDLKRQDALDQERTKIAAKIYNSDAEEDESPAEEEETE